MRKPEWETLTVADVIGPDPKILLVGLNPGRMSATHGHHFAGPGNHFWRLLHEAGLTPRQLAPAEEQELRHYGIAVTNVVTRATRGEGDLAWDEFLAGAAVLREKVARLRPRVVGLLGKQVYLAYAGRPKSTKATWGLQETETVPGVKEVAAPNPSARSTVPYATRLQQFRCIARLAGLT